MEKVIIIAVVLVGVLAATMLIPTPDGNTYVTIDSIIPKVSLQVNGSYMVGSSSWVITLNNNGEDGKYKIEVYDEKSRLIYSDSSSIQKQTKFEISLIKSEEYHFWIYSKSNGRWVKTHEQKWVTVKE